MMSTGSCIEVSLTRHCRCRSYCSLAEKTCATDIKPSNILVNSKGDIKICDFGVSGELINSVANTFVGTSTYMSVSPGLGRSRSRCGELINLLCLNSQPERIQGGNYSVKSDIWSLGISLIELALGRFPFMNDDDQDNSDNDSDLEEMRRTITGRDDGQGRVVEDRKPKQDKPPKPPRQHQQAGGGGMNMSILDLLQHIVNEPAPRLVPAGKYPVEAEQFVEDCLRKEPGERKAPKELLVSAASRLVCISIVRDRS